MVSQGEAGFVNGNFYDIRFGISGGLLLTAAFGKVSGKRLELLARFHNYL